MRLIEKDTGCKFTRIGAPRVEDVLKASSESATEVIKRVHPEIVEVFMPTAEELLKEQGPTAFAAALAHLAGFSQLPASRSLITHEEVHSCFVCIHHVWSVLENPPSLRYSRKSSFVAIARV